MIRYNLGDVVTCESGYDHKEKFKVVGIREQELELEGDWSGGTHNVCQKSWTPIKECSLVEPKMTGEKYLLKSMFEATFNCNDFFFYACSDEVVVEEEDFRWMISLGEKWGYDGIYAALAYISNMEPIQPHINDKFKEAMSEIIKNNQFVHSDFDYGDNFKKDGPYRKVLNRDEHLKELDKLILKQK